MRMKLAFLAIFVGTCLSASGAENDVSRQLDVIFSDPGFHRALWAVKVQSAETGETLFEKNPHKYVLPASNMKLVTALAAVEKLGLDFVFETVVGTDGQISNGVLEGNLIVVGSGDPTLGARISSPDSLDSRQGDPTAVFREWSSRLKQLGVKKIHGDIVGDDRVFDTVRLGGGWAWDDLPYGYSAEISGLQFNENSLFVEVIAGSTVGQPSRVEVLPRTGYLDVTSRLETVEAWEEWDYQVRREPGSNRVALEGSIGAGTPSSRFTVAVENPTSYFVTALRETLLREGIEVTGSPMDSAALRDRVPELGSTLFVHRSPDLRYILKVFLKISQNLYGETLVRALDRRPREKSYDGGRTEVEQVLTSIGIPSDAYVLADGSGLSLQNYLTADTVVRLLQHIYRSPYREDFLSFLPLAAEDGTIASRMKRTAAAKNVLAKTGTLKNVRALSGFVKTKSGETLAFSMIVNHYTQPRRSAELLQDLALEYLANLARPRAARGGEFDR